MIRADIQPGVCNLQTKVEADSPDGMTVHLQITSECPKVQALAADLQALDAFQELFKPLSGTLVVELAAKNKLHTTCLAPMGILKAVEAAAGLALPAESRVTLTKEE